MGQEVIVENIQPLQFLNELGNFHELHFKSLSPRSVIG